MTKLRWGSGIGLDFNSYADYYECLGYITNSKHQIDVFTHNNETSGAWSGQGKLKYNGAIHLMPKTLQIAFKTSGDNRLSITSYVENLISKHGFTLYSDPTGKKYTYYRFPESVEDVISTVPKEYHDSFIDGYNM